MPAATACFNDFGALLVDYHAVQHASPSKWASHKSGRTNLAALGGNLDSPDQCLMSGKKTPREGTPASPRSTPRPIHWAESAV